MQILLFRLFGHKPVTNIERIVTKFNSTYPTNRPTEDEWSKEFKFGSRYGTRGSFYQNR